MCVNGNFRIELNGKKTNVNKEEIILLPAKVEYFKMNSEEATVLEIYL